VDPAERQALEDEYRRQRERLISERDKKIDSLTG
jgi:LPS O-antigen subunit length determinant protein (WzzB/FepE family)